jgi:hypothetical protein
MKLWNKSVLLATVLAIPFGTLAACVTEHHEETKTNWDGTTTHKEETVRRNPVTGDTTIDKDESHH